MEKDPKLNLFANYNSQFVAAIQIHADSQANFPKVFESFEKLSSHVNTAVPPTEGTVFTLVQTLSTIGHTPLSLR
jgi:hypothetical protein